VALAAPAQADADEDEGPGGLESAPQAPGRADEAEEGDQPGDLPQAVTLLPADVQMIGYRVMWALAGVVALAASVISWFLRAPETEPAAGPQRAATGRAAAPA
jgi:hypothetical protein